MLQKIFFLLMVFFSVLSSARADESLYKIIEREDLDAFSDMVILGYSVDELDANGNTPLIIAADLGKKNFVQFLLLNEALANKRAADGTVALHHAAKGGYVDVIKLLCKEGAFINFPDYQGFTPLMYAVLYNKIDAVQSILDLGGDPNFINAQNQTALSIALSKRFYPIAALLEKKKIH